MTIKERLKSHRRMVKVNADLAAKSAERKDYTEAAKYYNWAHTHQMIANALAAHQ